MSSFFMSIIAAKARWAAALSGELIISPMAAGTICHETPNLSVSQPHATSAPPCDSFCHRSSSLKVPVRSQKKPALTAATAAGLR